MDQRNPYEEALGWLDANQPGRALDVLRGAGRNPDPLAYDEACAEVELDRGDYGAAAGLAVRTLKADRETARLHAIAAEALWYLGTREEAKVHAAQAGDGTARIAFLRARIAMDESDFAEAERRAEEALRLAPAWTAAEATRLAARAASGDRDARVALRLLWERTRDGWSLQALLGDGLRRRDPSFEDDLLRDAQVEGVLDASLLAKILWARNHRRDWDRTIAAFEAAPEEARNTAYALRARGVASFHKGDPSGALPYLERAYALEPADEWTVDRLFKTLVYAGQWRRATKLVFEHRRARNELGIAERSIWTFRRDLKSRSAKHPRR